MCIRDRTDTGSFQYSNVSYRTHEIVSKLISNEINQSEIHNKVYNDSSISRLKVLGSALKNLHQIKELKQYLIGKITQMILKKNTTDI